MFDFKNTMNCLLSALILFSTAIASAQVGGFNMTELDQFLFDANPAPGGPKTDAQKAVDHVKRLGGKHVELNVRALMYTGTGTEVVPITPPAERSNEAKRILRLIKYIKSEGLTVGLRPIFFVVGPNGEFPFEETLPDGSKKAWWHGNIQPSDPDRWFDSFRTYLDIYAVVAKLGKVEQFTIGAELYSMTVGIEDQWKAYPYGFPGRWLSLLRYIKAKLPDTQVMYDINFTDDSNSDTGILKSGGELERWRYRLVDLAEPKNPDEHLIWEDLVNFWKELDAVGIDMYRSLASRNQVIPVDYTQLVALLKQRSGSYASQLDTTWTEISLTVGVEKKFYFKEIGYRSVEKGFIDPFTYASAGGTVSIPHQAASYDAYFSSFWDAKWPWFGGVYFWDIAIDPGKVGVQDKGFSPISKDLTEATILRRFPKGQP